MSDTVHDRRLAAVLAGHRRDTAAAVQLLADPEPSVREAALGALHRIGSLDETTVRRCLADPAPAVRRRAVETAITHFGIELTPLLDDPEPRVVEAAAFALGERDTDPSPIPLLVTVAADHPDELCRETAIAALGALGAHPEADHRAVVNALLGALTERATIRRRAVIGLHQFDDEDAVAAVRAALTDHDRQVRALAGELLGESVD